MTPPPPRTLRVKCATWDQVEAFYLRKLRRGRSVTIKVPFLAVQGDAIAVGLELPNGVVVVIDGAVAGAQVIADDRTSLDIDLHGLTTTVVDQLEQLVAQGRDALGYSDQTDEVNQFVTEGIAHVTAGPYGEDAARQVDDPAHAVVITLDAELRRMRQLAVHEVLGVPWDAGPLEVRAGWRRLCQQFHPDALASHGSPAVTHLAEELMILVNRAYERLRASLVSEGRAAAVGPAMRPEKGWLVGFEAVSTGQHEIAALPPAPSPPRRRKNPSTGVPSVRFEQTTETQLAAVDSGITTTMEVSLARARAQSSDNPFEQQARAKLSAGDHAGAREVLAAALYAYPRNTTLRALYHVAAAVEASLSGEPERARSQLEAAIAVDAMCPEAHAALEQMRLGLGLAGLFR